MCSEIAKKQKIVADGVASINKCKQNIEKGLANRKIMKTTIEAEKMKKALLEPTLRTLYSIETEQTTRLALITAKLDEKSLREKADIEKYREIVKLYKTTCLERREEYEAMIPLAGKRREAKVALQLMEIKVMVLIQKRDELKKKLKQKREIDEKRMQVQLVEMARIFTERYKMQEKLKSMDAENGKLAEELQALKLHKEKLMIQREEEERARLRARQMMPPPRLDMSVLKTIDPRSNTGPLIHRGAIVRNSVDSDNLSINTAVLEGMIRDQSDDQSMETFEEDDTEVITPNPLARSISKICCNQEDFDKIEVLERSYSQLSLDKENNYENSPINSPDEFPIEVEVTIQSGRVMESPVRQPSSILKAQSIQRMSEETSEGAPEEKRAKVEPRKELDKQSGENCHEEKHRQPPKIQSVETITRSILLQTKPLVAEVTPTLSNLYSPRHYAPSVCPSIDLDADFDEFETVRDLPNEWPSPPRGCVSEASSVFDEPIGKSAHPTPEHEQQKLQNPVLPTMAKPIFTNTFQGSSNSGHFF
ncbi:uncharacterized protein [Fopius arisanus]|uniref:Uncharacterized protein n=1 Tax=Fopius arisanus TaxID=64838 RepID=A0A9R1T6E1_9HYME|nr:PREDICTED: uncharacterized protein LOC105267183 [Fopius arisanus]